MGNIYFQYNFPCLDLFHFDFYTSGLHVTTTQGKILNHESELGVGMVITAYCTINVMKSIIAFLGFSNPLYLTVTKQDGLLFMVNHL